MNLIPSFLPHLRDTMRRMDNRQRIIENPLDYLRPTWRGTLIYVVLVALAAGAVIIWR